MNKRCKVAPSVSSGNQVCKKLGGLTREQYELRERAFIKISGLADGFQ